MASPVKLISVRKISPPPSPETEMIWLFHAYRNLSESAQVVEWIPYPAEISSSLENAVRYGLEETFINDTHRIDFIELLEVRMEDPTCCRPIRRCSLTLFREIERMTKLDPPRCERLSFRLNTNLQCSTSVDTAYHGSQFVRDWLLKFTNGKLSVKFNDIFPALINGLKDEGRQEPKNIVNDIVRILNSAKDESCKMNEKKRMKKLQDCCIKLYTKQCYVFRIVNTALRDDDRTKLDTLGPYCYLVYNCIGRHIHDQHLLELLHRNKSHSMTVYRGDSAPRKTIEEYRQAASRKEKYFKWLSFVSTSADRIVAEHFALNVLYVIEVERYLSMDQYTDLDTNTYFESEQEILLKPGTRFRVTKVELDSISGRHLVHIKIIPSYVSHLR
ncbi:unnamed protein product [Rotaria sp. Silwood2]|nr:unnamed protein product [Rotaria sp. Silwood2]CAF2746169.1 unnamed protein product [Rotaria sp. Silwood2]CAF3014668.1 unnamed protein product [Rotaria sp. Silwood2]CAF3156399.1 unnamed protein product [Rotaria sp. Silwood2]CAF4362771.1 unnamed protein product [Rotaria sp. Silwood2]